MKPPRLLPHRNFPRYAYLPGRQPHPTRHPAGHSYQSQHVAVVATGTSEEFVWGKELFNHGYYWEAHEAWEAIWNVAERGGALRGLLKGLILLSATGVKIREGKRNAALRHAGRAAGLFRGLSEVPNEDISQALGMPPEVLAEIAEAAAAAPRYLRVLVNGEPETVFDFVLGDGNE